jgi:hypothetical protein
MPQVRGNLRAERSEVFELVCENLKKEFGEPPTMHRAV